ncbi:MAG: hypothetical protein A2504_07060 [Bdellovibrionales bacterium RIFOXYD12_FULL_39_22]|nr:MAG: hypothetical protein A2385_05275 [Bdellovibrionales bacterium RIFOXYB1_FULL_39_21]OFZ44334.1 MAG: hypothetical protein A2485_16055 [Bdellovibrionales bacterium RIFOXYC12_FULL_39_17]OFZ76997.1 MAG: hypothetical protein A2560_11080 [Bdellovibrionales bacterium RIFOXYD1_FULL_39_84]OFZ95210.1 MAG: hypothetical protein A2504_07060 [Bdellovibrionales bacterium RIFOXYD12_FULL_39_22]HLE09637.1 radical SAM protein [Bacteriovoracaceae bacterium]
MQNFNSSTQFDLVGNDSEALDINWALTNYCNYDCSYCYNKTLMRRTPNKNAEYKVILKRLKMCQVCFDILLDGGEPTKHPNLQFILEELEKIDNCKQIEVHTNFTESIDYYYNLRNITKLNIKASYHPEYHYNFIEKLKMAIAEKKNNFMVSVNLSSDKKFWNKTEEVIIFCQTHAVGYELNYLHDTENVKIGYTEQFFKIFDQYITNRDGAIVHVIDNKIYNFTESKIYQLGLTYKGMSCFPRMYRIESNGEIINGCNGIKLPLVIKKEHVNQAYICPHEICSCSEMLFFKRTKKYQ